MSVESAKAKLDAQPGDPATGYISKADHQDSYTELVDDTALTGATTAEALTISGNLNGRDPDNLVAGPASATDNALVRFDGTGGKTVQGSGITVDDSGNFTSDLTISKTAPVVTISDSSGSNAANLLVSSPAGYRAAVALRSATSNRWLFRKTSDAETGSNAGSNWEVVGVDDSGNQRVELRITRSTGRWTVGSVGATAGLELGTSGPRIMSGTGSPEGVVTAPVGSTWRDTNATTGAIKWIKASGSGNTGWRVEYGDTGLRNLSAETLLNGWTIYASAFNLRRVGNMVEVNLWPDKTSASADSLYTIPSGFRPAVAYARFTQATNVDDDYCRGYIMSTGDFRVLRSTMTGAIPYIYLTYVTSDPWPTSLPGTAA